MPADSEIELMLSNHNWHTYMVTDNMHNVLILCTLLELAKIIDQRSHAGREVKYMVHQFT